MNDFLPVCRRDMERRGWDQLDFLFVTGDAYVDHPTFANGLIARWMEFLGYRIGVIAQPDWRGRSDFEAMGEPRLAVFVSAGNLDSMLNKLTASRNKRGHDAYSPNGEAGHRPDRATIVYCNRVREIWGRKPLIVGGIEASMRRFSHYDYWSDKVRRPMLADCKADLLIYGMGELQLKEIAARLEAGVPAREIDSVPGTCVMKKSKPGDCVEIPPLRGGRGRQNGLCRSVPPAKPGTGPHPRHGGGAKSRRPLHGAEQAHAPADDGRIRPGQRAAVYPRSPSHVRRPRRSPRH